MASGCTRLLGWLKALNLPPVTVFKIASAMMERAELPVQEQQVERTCLTAQVVRAGPQGDIGHWQVGPARLYWLRSELEVVKPPEVK
jgi:hypothetical protein